MQVINDLHSMIVAFYRCARFHHEALIAELDLALGSREDFTAYEAQTGLTEIQRVAQWFVRNCVSWAGAGETWGFSAARTSLDRRKEGIRSLHARLDRVVIEHMPYQKCMKSYDRTESFFFIDPPYLNAPTGAYAGFSLADIEGSPRS